MTEVAPRDLAWLIICSVRYSLGRMSYAPSYTAEMVLKYAGALTADERRILVEDIRRYLDFTSRVGEHSISGGHPPDIIATWESLAKALEEMT
jgi:hypothetical protein